MSVLLVIILVVTVGTLHWLPELSAGLVALLGWMFSCSLLTRRDTWLMRPHKFWLWCVLAFARVGEAANPGPCIPWKVGTANPTGLASKLDQVAFLDGDTWFFSETHLTQQAFRRLVGGLRALKSPFISAVPGAPCTPRMSELSGEYSGVLMVSKGPGCALVHNFDEASYKTSRIQITGFLVGQLWIQAGICYGYPKGHSHDSPVYQTDALLEQVVDRLTKNTTGPRVLAGDVNHPEAELVQLQRLQSLGWREAQSFAASQWGQPQEATGRGNIKLDQLWFSPELLPMIHKVEVRRDRWTDHATVEVSLQINTNLMYASVWNRPKPLQWPQDWQDELTWDQSLNPTEAYAHLWQQAETAAAQRIEGVHRSQCGRGQTLHPKTVVVHSAPLRTGRKGEVAPGYHGISLRHAQWFRQLRRLQAAVRVKTACHQGADEKSHEQVKLTCLEREWF